MAKKLLILGGTSASLDLVKKAHELGAYVYVADDRDTGVAKEIADEKVKISTTDIEGLAAYVKEKGIDGAFCGPSEFNLRNLFKLCAKAGLPCYTTTEGWDRCANKDEFTACCRRFGVDVPEEYDVHENMTDADYAKIDFPIILKPVDGCSSIGISVCRTKEEVPAAYRKVRRALHRERRRTFRSALPRTERRGVPLSAHRHLRRRPGEPDQSDQQLHVHALQVQRVLYGGDGPERPPDDQRNGH